MLKLSRNKSVVVNNTEKKVGPATADVNQVIEESKRLTRVHFYFLRKNKQKSWFSEQYHHNCAHI